MKLEVWNKRNCLFELPDESNLDIIKEAIKLKLIPENTHVFVGSSRTFCKVEGQVLRTYRMRENWNGWHDVAAYSLPNFEKIGTRIDADSPAGRHRDVVVINS